MESTDVRTFPANIQLEVTIGTAKTENEEAVKVQQFIVVQWGKTTIELRLNGEKFREINCSLEF